ncbi:hypothetical protein JQX13_07190 [Archangium violaceum]|uniref:hypothetical protein n=1 Tax=Archangium violaceum TaxID=83451 RepID=UPI00193BCC58|nr:hypothetical protein [Archangium violaceum]QRK09883.1 hypothetical protein JQX13_07190 [Archangium violaceum]
MFMRSLFDGDRLVGLWEYDLDAGAVVFGTFDFVLDNDEAVRERAAIVKAL